MTGGKCRSSVALGGAGDECFEKRRRVSVRAQKEHITAGKLKRQSAPVGPLSLEQRPLHELKLAGVNKRMDVEIDGILQDLEQVKKTHMKQAYFSELTFKCVRNKAFIDRLSQRERWTVLWNSLEGHYNNRVSFLLLIVTLSRITIEALQPITVNTLDDSSAFVSIANSTVLLEIVRCLSSNHSSVANEGKICEMLEQSYSHGPREQSLRRLALQCLYRILIRPMSSDSQKRVSAVLMDCCFLQSAAQWLKDAAEDSELLYHITSLVNFIDIASYEVKASGTLLEDKALVNQLSACLQLFCRRQKEFEADAVLQIMNLFKEACHHSKAAVTYLLSTDHSLLSFLCKRIVARRDAASVDLLIHLIMSSDINICEIIEPFMKQFLTAALSEDADGEATELRVSFGLLVAVCWSQGCENPNDLSMGYLSRNYRDNIYHLMEQFLECSEDVVCEEAYKRMMSVKEFSGKWRISHGAVKPST